MFVGLLYLALQIVIPLAQYLGFLLQRVVVRDLPRHARVAARDADEHQNCDTEHAERTINNPVRDVDALQAPVNRVREYNYKVILLQGFILQSFGFSPVCRNPPRRLRNPRVSGLSVGKNLIAKYRQFERYSLARLSILRN